ncbi:MAG: response regulator [Mucilaginibacter sp.]
MCKRILILDDDKDVLDVMQEALTYEGFEVQTISATENIFPVLEQYRPDILLIDYLLNGINGGEICSQIKKNEHTHNLPVVILSAYPRVINSLGYYQCNKFISKPFDLDELVGGINLLTDGKG